ncbi:MAG: phosphatidate cytidylyltransferase [Culicoidibacterales bacterium]
MSTRILSGIVIAVIVIAAVALGGWYFNGLILISFAIGLSEMLRMPQSKFQISNSVQIALIMSFIVQIVTHVFFPSLTLYFTFVPIFGVLIYGMFQREQMSAEQMSFIVMCYVYMLLPALAAISLYQISLWLIVLVGLIAAGTDSGAYFTGVFFGKHKLAPEISPKKTIEGSIGGSLVGLVLAIGLFPYLLQQFAPDFWQTYAMFFSGGTLIFTGIIVLALSVATQFGDLVASNMKRQFCIKDFGNIFPGHGGIMDRVDGILVVLTLLAFVIEIGHLFLT